MMVAYIAGAFRGPDAWTVERNIRRAEETAFEVWKLGAVALCPHTNTRFFDKALPDEVWLTGDLELLRRCDCLVLAPGWEKSQGALAEMHAMQALGRPIYKTVMAFADALRATRHPAPANSHTPAETPR